MLYTILIPFTVDHQYGRPQKDGSTVRIVS
jgi:hypothetical protein